MKKKSGPKIKPSGSPARTGFQNEVYPCKTYKTTFEIYQTGSFLEDHKLPQRYPQT